MTGIVKEMVKLSHGTARIRSVALQKIMTGEHVHRRAIRQAVLPELEYSEDLFRFTRGRFICDEKNAMSQRYVRFNVEELARCAARATGAKTCVQISKYPDGMHNKCMLLTMDNGAQVVAKVPNPNAGLPHLTTASEVATMDFVRNVLGNPVPKVLAWCSQAQQTLVGAEYIIMERAPGIELEHVWPTLGIKDRFAIVKTIAEYQKSWSSISFTKYGSLYFSRDLDQLPANQPLYYDAAGNQVTNTAYAVGPSMGREGFDDGRGMVNFCRGPWHSVEAYHIAIGDREKACIQQLAELPKSPITLCGPGTYQPTKAKKLKALRFYFGLLSHVLPKDRVTSSAHLWHGDLHLGNIFVDPSEPTKVVALIDWQSTELGPLYFQARQPHIIDYVGSPVTGLVRPQRRDDLGKLSPSAKQEAENLYLQKSLCSLYNALMSRQCPRIYAALEYQQTQEYLLLLLARNLLIDGEITYLSQIAEMASTWTENPLNQGLTNPFSFLDNSRDELEADLQGVERGMEAMRSIRDNLGELFSEQGIVRHEQYDEALDALAQLKEQVIDTFASNEEEQQEWEKQWPFRP